jgi:hypothetical protein
LGGKGHATERKSNKYKINVPEGFLKTGKKEENFLLCIGRTQWINLVGGLFSYVLVSKRWLHLEATRRMYSGEAPVALGKFSLSSYGIQASTSARVV